MKYGFASIIAILLIILLLTISGFFFYRSTSTTPEEVIITPIEQYEDAKNDVKEIDQKINGFTASFEINTLGTKRIFTDAMYHNLSQEVYISQPDSSIVHVKRKGVTWSEFFKTLPFSLDKQCLVTGTKQTFCTNQNQRLQFVLNGVENPDALDRVINEGDELKVIYQ